MLSHVKDLGRIEVVEASISRDGTGPSGRYEGDTEPTNLGREDLVHDLGTGGDHRAQFTAIHDLGGAGTGVPDQAGDLFHGHARVRHQADKRSSQLAGRPALGKPGRPGDLLEHPADVGRVERGADRGAEHQIVICQRSPASSR
jgi:hypothetical protein